MTCRYYPSSSLWIPLLPYPFPLATLLPAPTGAGPGVRGKLQLTHDRLCNLLPASAYIFSERTTRKPSD